MPAAELFMWMLFAHFVGDYHLQSRWVAQEKRTRTGILFVHAFLCAGPVCMALEYAGYFEWGYLFGLVCFHMGIDLLKIRGAIGDTLGQVFHIGVLLGIIGFIYQ